MSEPKRRKEGRSAHAGTERSVGYGYVGRWSDGTLGWFLPDHLTGDKWTNDPPSTHECAHNATFVLCRVTVEQVFDSRKRAITRRVPTAEPGHD